MGTSRISSSTMVAKSAVSKLTSVEGEAIQNENISFAGSTLPCMKSAQKLTNKMLNDIGELVGTIQTQADKITELSEIIEQRDKEDASDLSKMTWGF